MNSSQQLRILQYNVHKSKDVITPLLEDPRIQQFHLILVQEPWRNQHIQTSYNPSQSNFHLLYHPHAETRVAIYISKSIPTTDWKVRHLTPDLSVLDLKVQFTDVVRTIRIYNVYNPPPRSKQDNTGPSTLPDLDKDFQESPCEHSMVFGDFNLHHPLWGGRTLLSQHAYADKLIDITEEHNLVQLTLPGTITYSQNGESTIDLAFATSGIANMLVQCIVRKDIEQQSDHFPIATILQLQTAKQEVVPRRV